MYSSDIVVAIFHHVGKHDRKLRLSRGQMHDAFGRLREMDPDLLPFIRNSQDKRHKGLSEALDKLERAKLIRRGLLGRACEITEDLDLSYEAFVKPDLHLRGIKEKRFSDLAEALVKMAGGIVKSRSRWMTSKRGMF